MSFNDFAAYQWQMFQTIFRNNMTPDASRTKTVEKSVRKAKKYATTPLSSIKKSKAKIFKHLAFSTEHNTKKLNLECIIDRIKGNPATSKKNPAEPKLITKTPLKKVIKRLDNALKSAEAVKRPRGRPRKKPLEVVIPTREA